MSLGKKILTITLSVLCVVALGLDVFYYCLLKNAPEKHVSQTFNISGQVITKVDEETGEVTTERKPLIELNLYDNVFEVVFNNIADENQNSFFSKGVQYVANNGKLNFDLNYTGSSEARQLGETTSKSVWLGKNYYSYYDSVYTKSSFKNLTAYQYSSSDGFDSTLNNDMASPLNTDTFFKVQLTEGSDKKLYGMTLKNTKTYYDNEGKVRDNIDSKYYHHQDLHYSSEYLVVANHYYYNYINRYIPIDFNYLVVSLYNSISGVAKGTSQEFVIKFEDYFDFWELDSDKTTYKMITNQDKMSKVSAEVSSYFIMKVNVHDGEMKYSNQSLMNMFKGTANLLEPVDDEEYFDSNYLYGKTVLKAEFNANTRDFDLVSTGTANSYIFVLKKEFIEYYAGYEKDIVIEIEIDKAYLKSNGITLSSIDLDSFGNFQVKGVENYV